MARAGGSGSRWAGICSSDLRAKMSIVSRGVNQLDIFALSTDHALYYLNWNGSSWGQWQSLGGDLLFRSEGEDVHRLAGRQPVGHLRPLDRSRAVLLELEWLELGAVAVAGRVSALRACGGEIGRASCRGRG